MEGNSPRVDARHVRITVLRMTVSRHTNKELRLDLQKQEAGV